MTLGPLPLAEAAPPARASLARLRIRDFRNVASVEVAFPPDGLVVIGENGQGKTNFLEAIYYLQLLRSCRGARDQELVRFGAAGFHLTASVHGGRAPEVAVGFERATKRKRVRIGGLEAARLSDALGAFPAVIFSPHDASLLSGPPGLRRRYLDVVLALTSGPYLAALQRYRAALVRRNAALREAGAAGDAARRATVWEPLLAQYGATIWMARREWTERHAARFAELCSAVGERGVVSLRYVSALEPGTDVVGALREAFERRRETDVRRGSTHVGPHRDDLEITLTGPEGAPHDLRVYGSAGQQRTAAIALRLLEGDSLRAYTGSEPVVLLDDPFAELDTRRAARILELLDRGAGGQTVLAVPRAGDIPRDLTRLERWCIRDGTLARTSSS